MTRPNDLQFHFTSPDFLQNPYPFYKRLREESPVYLLKDAQSKELWLITRFEDVKASLMNTARFSSGGERGMSTLKKLPESVRETYADFLEFYRKWVLLNDPPDHTRLRKLANKGFTNKHVDAMAPYMRGLAEGLLEGLADRDEVDLMSEFAYIMPAMTILEMLGVPKRDREQLIDWSNQIAKLIGLAEISADTLRDIRTAYTEMRGYFIDHIQHLKQNPMANVLSDLIAAADEGDKLSEEELYAQAVVLLIGGHETTRNLIGNGLHLLLNNPQQLDLLRQRPDLIKPAIEEFLRLESPVQFVGRTARERFVMHGQQIEKGQLVMLMIGAANRDPDIFGETADSLDIDAERPKNLAFGMGQHFCLGAYLARVQAQIALEAFLERFPNARMAGAKPTWVSSPVFRGLTRLDLKLN